MEFVVKTKPYKSEKSGKMYDNAFVEINGVEFPIGKFDNQYSIEQIIQLLKVSGKK